MVRRPQHIAEEYKDSTTYDAILDAAERLCGERGVGGLKLREVARRVGIEPPSIYNHFKGIDGILGALVQRALLDQMSFYRMPDGLRGQAAMQELCLRSATYMANRKGVARLILNDFAEVHEEKNAFDRNEATLIRLYDQESAFLTEHLGLGHVSRQQLGQIALARMSMTIVLLAQRWIAGKDPTEAQIREIAHLVATFMQGLPDNVDAVANSTLA